MRVKFGRRRRKAEDLAAIAHQYIDAMIVTDVSVSGGERSIDDGQRIRCEMQISISGWEDRPLSWRRR